MKLLILHYHFRPGGVRRVIELATPHLLTHAPRPVEAVVLAAGEAPDPAWLQAFRERLHPVLVELFVEPAFGYLAELRAGERDVRRRIVRAISVMLSQTLTAGGVVWAHNLGLGRNLHLAHELAEACHSHDTPLISHHHDWWFENRWHHFTAWRGLGVQRLAAVADAVFPDTPQTCHLAINRADAAVLVRHFPGRAGWLPNPAGAAAPPPAARVARARAWLRGRIGEAAPVWLLPCRLLRRKNVAEALLLMRWLRPEGWLVTTGGVSSADEQPYAEALTAAARTHGWRVRLGVLAGDQRAAPSMPELLAASEAVLFTSVQEGFGLPFLEAAIARRPLVARSLPNIAPDLAQFGFTFPQSYADLWVDPALFDWQGERRRQMRLFAGWKRGLPRSAARLAGRPVMLAAGVVPCPVPFSRLTLTAQLEVLAQPIERSWERCVRLNPFLEEWRGRAVAGRLKASPWPRSAERWLGGRAYARRFYELLPAPGAASAVRGASRATQAEFLRAKLSAGNLYPILWNPRT